MDLNTLSAISPIDGRYRSKVQELGAYFSEFGLIKYRLYVEIEYFIALCQLPLPQLKSFPDKMFNRLREIYQELNLQDAMILKEYESVTNHDVKAVEYFVKKKFEELELQQFSEFVHFGLTSQDINNTAVPASLKDSMNIEYYPLMDGLIGKLVKFAREWSAIPMLARTHGQPASPTRLGKEIRVFIERLEIQLADLKQIPFSAKFGGATGNLNAHKVAYPAINWIDFANRFVNEILGLKRSQTTTQIDHYDQLAALLDCFRRINTILIDLARDMWTYISMEYFKQKIVAGEVGSSAMPHKVNPIDFENAEGNLGMANALYEHLAAKLPISRLQRDLTDSTVLRNIGVPIAHSFIAVKSLMKGLDKLIVNEQKIKDDLDHNWAVVAEAIQTILRREGYPRPFEALKQLTRTHQEITRETLWAFIDSLDLDEQVRNEIKQVTPQNYTGF